MAGFGVNSAVATDDNSASDNSTISDNSVSDNSVDDGSSSDGSVNDDNSVSDDSSNNDNSADNKAVDDGSSSDGSVNDDNSVSDDSSNNDNSADNKAVDDGSASDGSVNDDNSVSDDSSSDDSASAGSTEDNSISDGSSEDNSVQHNSTDDIVKVNEETTEEKLGNSVAVNKTLEDKGNWTEDENTLHPVYYEESPELQENINNVDTHNVFINNEQNVNISFINNSVVNNINIEANKVSGNTTVVVEELKNKSSLTGKTPVGNIYKSFNIWVDNGAGNIGDASINFQVKKAWINSNKIDQSTIILNIYTKGEWTKVPVTVTGEDTEYIYYKAEVASNSSFAITGQQVADSHGKVNNPTGQASTSSKDGSNENILETIIERVLALLNGENSSKASLEQTTTTTTAHSANTAANKNLTVHFLDVGQGDSILIEYENKTMLVDAGESDQGEIISNYLQSQGISTLDYLVATHPHSDHIGGMNDVLNHFKVKRFVDSGYPYTSKTYENMLETIDKKNVSFETPKRGDKIDFASGIDVKVLNPDTTYYDDVNQNSIVLKLTDKNVSFLLMGDAGLEAENDIMKDGYDVNADVLKVGHHGSRTASGASFISAVSPEISVIEVGAGNEYGHPHAETLERLEKTSKVYRTDLDGTITITTDGSTYSVTTQKNGSIEETKSVTSGSGAYSSTDSTTTQNTTPEENVTSSSAESTVYVSDLNLKGEWVKVTNKGSSPVSLTGWRIEDDGSKHTYTFPSYTLNSGSTTVVYTGKGIDSATELYWGSGNPIWNNDGDTAHLFDSSGKLVSTLEG